MEAFDVLMVAALFALVVVALALVVLLYRSKASERTLTSALAKSKRETQEAGVQAKLIDDKLQQALAKLRALTDVEQRYRGVLDLETFVANLKAQGITLQAEQTEQRLAHRKASPLVRMNPGVLARTDPP